LRFAEAAGLYEQAANLLPAEDRNARGTEWLSAGARWTDQGRDFADNPALVNAITACRTALEHYIRERVPKKWAATQNNLGVALMTLGERETGTERLEEAVAALRAALEEYTRERMPLDWAMTQSNLGMALATLGERESGTERLEEAVAAYRAALEEGTRERVPLQWALTHNNLGAALWKLGEHRDLWVFARDASRQGTGFASVLIKGRSIGCGSLAKFPP
jgi:tetratricopeptide (TPR) repeat protein